MKKLAFLMMAAACFTLTACPSSQPENAGEEITDETTDQTVTETEPQVKVLVLQDANLFFTKLNDNFEVKGNPDIESFARALPIYDDEFGFLDEYDGEYTMDKKAGYFRYSFEGDGSESFEGAYWNRTDGKKLMILSYHESLADMLDGLYQASEEHYFSSWYYAYQESSIWNGDDASVTDVFTHEVGFAAYLYNEETHMLEMLSEPPFNGWQAKDTDRYLILPQKGKDIEVVDISGDEPVSTMLKWNGMTFDYQE